MSEQIAPQMERPSVIGPDYMEQLQHHQALRQEALQENLILIWDAMYDNALKRIVLSYDCRYDVIDTPTVCFEDRSASVAMPDVIRLPTAVDAMGLPAQLAAVFPDTLSDVAWLCVQIVLGRSKPDWNDGAGGYGEAVFDLSTRDLSVSHMQRIVDHEAYTFQA
ncbi:MULTISPECIES: DUF6878 family protein [Asaia]|uniref:DUF6878 domain-containing protein n=1 Tax=Asaia bogorensis TaxID=91915 RepID=A0A060QDY5_9PROT|nr:MULTISPECIES: DUF6878 family protein [Asaia]ETC99516.1 hypothetical protein P792_03525 [Asaia sp. SF2.1]CDG38908.1 hypothetical protein ASAP_0863 [Asaia bogorensis]